MSVVTQSPDVSQLSPTDLPRFLALILKNIVKVVNGNLDFQTNFNCVLVNITFSAVDTDTQVTHNLGRIPVGRIVYAQSMKNVVYDGSKKSTPSSMFLRCSSTGTASLIVF